MFRGEMADDIGRDNYLLARLTDPGSVLGIVEEQLREALHGGGRRSGGRIS